MAADSMLTMCRHHRTRAFGSQVKVASNAARRRLAAHLWNVTPSSIVPYIVMPLAPLDDGAEPPAQAVHMTASAAAAKRAKKRFIKGQANCVKK
jgi:hypothetical protein